MGFEMSEQHANTLKISDIKWVFKETYNFISANQKTLLFATCIPVLLSTFLLQFEDNTNGLFFLLIIEIFLYVNFQIYWLRFTKNRALVNPHSFLTCIDRTYAKLIASTLIFGVLASLVAIPLLIAYFFISMNWASELFIFIIPITLFLVFFIVFYLMVRLIFVFPIICNTPHLSIAEAYHLSWGLTSKQVLKYFILCFGVAFPIVLLQLFLGLLAPLLGEFWLIIWGIDLIDSILYFTSLAVSITSLVIIHASLIGEYKPSAT